MQTRNLPIPPPVVRRYADKDDADEDDDDELDADLTQKQPKQDAADSSSLNSASQASMPPTSTSSSTNPPQDLVNAGMLPFWFELQVSALVRCPICVYVGVRV